MSGSNRVPLRPKRADKHSIGFNPVGRINLSPFRGAAAAEANRFLPKLRRRARLRNRSGAHGSLNDTAPIFTRPDSRPTTARFDRSGFKFVGGSATRRIPPANFFPFSLFLFSPLPPCSRCKNSPNRENDRYDPIPRPLGNCVYSLDRACEIGDCFFRLCFETGRRDSLKFFATLGVSFLLVSWNKAVLKEDNGVEERSSTDQRFVRALSGILGPRGVENGGRETGERMGEK